MVYHFCEVEMSRSNLQHVDFQDSNNHEEPLLGQLRPRDGGYGTKTFNQPISEAAEGFLSASTDFKKVADVIGVIGEFLNSKSLSNFRLVNHKFKEASHSQYMLATTGRLFKFLLTIPDYQDEIVMTRPCHLPTRQEAKSLQSLVNALKAADADPKTAITHLFFPTAANTPACGAIAADFKALCDDVIAAASQQPRSNQRNTFKNVALSVGTGVVVAGSLFYIGLAFAAFCGSVAAGRTMSNITPKNMTSAENMFFLLFLMFMVFIGAPLICMLSSCHFLSLADKARSCVNGEAVNAQGEKLIPVSPAIVGMFKQVSNSLKEIAGNALSQQEPLQSAVVQIE